MNARQLSPVMRGLVRAGYVAKAVQYGTIGVLAAMAALGHRAGVTTDSKGALREIGEQPLGRILLVLMAIGLAGWALWRFVEAIFDPEHDAVGAKGALKRVGRFANGLLHSALVVYAIGLVTGAARGGRDGDAKGWTAQIMSWDGGVWLVGAVGVGLFAFAAGEMKKAWSCDLDEHLDLRAIPASARAWTIRISRFGLAARGVVFAIVGVFLVTAAWRSNPREAKGLGEALATLRSGDFGGLLLAIVAAGLVAYGVYEIVEARYRRIQPV